MAEKVKQQDTPRQVSEDQRFKFIGFEVYPGKPKDLFGSEAERTKLVEAIREKRRKGQVTREECKLFEERVTWIDKIVLTLACAVMIIALFFPWFAVYNEVVDTAAAPREAITEGGLTVSDAPATPAAAAPAGTTAGETAAPGAPSPSSVQSEQVSPSEEVISGFIARRQVHREYTRVSGLGALAEIGGAGSVVFSSGLGLMLSGVLIIAFILLCLALPVYTLYNLWAGKGTADEQALQLKRILRYHWALLAIFGLLVFLSFFGGEYGSLAAQKYSSLGDSYGPGVLLGVLSWGLIVALAASILAAAKGAEI